MKRYLLLILSLLTLSVQAGKPVIIYAMMTESTPVKLSTGAEWVMDKGDCFPIIAYKESHSKVILKLGSAEFKTEANRIREIKDHEVDVAALSYNKNLKTFEESVAKDKQANAESTVLKPAIAIDPAPATPAATQPKVTPASSANADDSLRLPLEKLRPAPSKNSGAQGAK